MATLDWFANHIVFEKCQNLQRFDGAKSNIRRKPKQSITAQPPVNILNLLFTQNAYAFCC